MATVLNRANSLTYCRRVGVAASAWIVGMTVWLAGVASLALFF